MLTFVIVRDGVNEGVLFDIVEAVEGVQQTLELIQLGLEVGALPGIREVTIQLICLVPEEGEGERGKI